MNVTGRPVAVWLFAILAIAAGACPCSAQTGPSSSTSPQHSDAVVLVQPYGDGVLLAVTFPQKRDNRRVRDLITALAHANGWTLESLKVADEEIKTDPRLGPSKSLGLQTGATAIVAHAPQVRDGGFILQPYLQAFSDLSRFEVLYFIPKDSAFRGLREFSENGVRVALVKDGGPYHYLIQITGHPAIMPTLPLTQAQPATAPIESAYVPAPVKRSDSGLMWVCLAAVVAGVGVYLTWFLAAQSRAKRSRQMTTRRAARP